MPKSWKASTQIWHQHNLYSAKLLKKKVKKGKCCSLLLTPKIALWRQKSTYSAISMFFIDTSLLLCKDITFPQSDWLNIASFVKSATFWNYSEKSGTFCFAKGKLLPWYLSITTPISLLTEIKLEMLLGMQTTITDSVPATSNSLVQLQDYPANLATSSFMEQSYWNKHDRPLQGIMWILTQNACFIKSVSRLLFPLMHDTFS